jgi:dTMP kinase
MPKKAKQKPKFIVVEGGEGSGKSTLLIALKEMLGDKIFVTREPGGSPYAEIIRTAALKNPLAKTAPADTTFCLMFAARFDNVKNSIKPSLENGVHVIADRFDSSTYAYQVSGQTGGSLEKLFWGFRERLEVTPDLYVFMDVDPREGLRRASLRNQSLLSGPEYDHFDDREVAFHEKVRKGYLEFFKKVPHLIIDANRPLEIVKADFLEQVKKVLAL